MEKAKAFFCKIGGALRSFFGRFPRRAYELTALILLSSLLLGDVAYHLISGLSDGVETMPAKVSTLSETLSDDAYLVYEELPLTASGGRAVYYVADGERVAEGTVLAAVYGDDASPESLSSLSVRYRVRRLLEQVETARPDKITETLRIQIAGVELEIDEALENGNFRQAAAKKKELEALLLCREKLEGTIEPEEAMKTVDAEIALLESVLGEPSEKITAPCAGWFSSSADGYAGAVGSGELSGMSYRELAGLFDKTSPEQADSAGGVLVGRLLTDYRWNAVVLVDGEEARLFSTGKRYEVELEGKSVTLTLDRAVFASEGDAVALVFSCGELTGALSFDRVPEMTLTLAEHRGYKIPTGALTYNDGVQGVYILRGFVVEFREIVIAYRDENMLIAEASPDESSEKFRLLAENDNVIVKGEDLYVGKIIK